MFLVNGYFMVKFRETKRNYFVYTALCVELKISVVTTAVILTPFHKNKG